MRRRACSAVNNQPPAKPLPRHSLLVRLTHWLKVLAYDLNGEALPVKRGGPMRLRVERQWGCKCDQTELSDR